MGTTTPNMGLSKPTLGADPGTWDDQNNASLDRVDIHNHTSGLGVRIPPGGLNINTDLTFAGNAATNLKAVNFFAQAYYDTNLALWVNSATNDLYYRRAGTDHRLTVNGVLNLSLVGGITGDYAAASAALYYDDTAEAYRFLEAAPSPNDWSYVKAGGFDLYEHASGISNFIGLRSPAALAASYNLTLPGALPASTVLAQVSSAGVVTFANTTITMASNQDVIVSGTGAFKHGDRVLLLSGTSAVYSANWAQSGTFSLDSSSTTPADLFIPLRAGERVKSFSIAVAGNGVADVAIAATVITMTLGATGIGSTLVSNPGASFTANAFDCTDTTLASGEALVLTFTPNATGIKIGNVSVTYDRP